MTIAAPDRRLRVFVVEDSEVLKKRLEEWLAANPLIALVGNAREAGTAIAEIRRLGPDVVILDVALARNTSGFEVLRALANGPSRPRPTVIVFTNHAGAPYREAALQLGAAQFFDKNTDFMRMVQEVARLADSRGARNGSEG